jgi:imidazolonepropionase-like amidohydrolase
MIPAALQDPYLPIDNQSRRGTVSEGKYADIIAVRGDVLRHIDLLQTVNVVIKHGTRYK